MDKISAKVVIRTDIRSSLTPSFAFPDLRILYPEVVVAGLTALYEEYNRAFGPLVEANREWQTDYRYSLQNGVPVNWAVQIDMVGLDDEFLQKVTDMSVEEVREIFRRQIFEIENSLALYHLLDRICDRGGERSFYSRGIRTLLDSLRERFGKPIALLAVTHEKYIAMLATEFGRVKGEPLPDTEVFELSGFDKFFGPEEFREHVMANGGDCQYLLYVRASDPVEKLKRPDTPVEHPLLGDTEMRRIIKQFAITFNVDDPTWLVGDPRRINDTKWYMPRLGMAFPVMEETDLYSTGFRAYLEYFGVNPVDVETGRQTLRFKPAQGTYGCYGHLRGPVTSSKLQRELRVELRRRGPYLVQPEHCAPTALNVVDGVEYAYIDRVFFGMLRFPKFLGGFREFLPADSQEAKMGRLHGNRHTVFAEIAPA